MAFLLWFYAVDGDGHWLFHRGARRLAKSSGKSPFAAVLALIEFCAPVRLERFDDTAPGGCRGKPVALPLVQIAATAESQTANTMRMVRAFAPKGSAVVEGHGLDPGKTRYYRVPEGTLEVITSSSTAAEGAEASFVVADETEYWVPQNGGVDLASTLVDNLTKSGSRMLETSNAWVPGSGSVAESTWDAWVAQEDGRLRGRTKILYDARLAPPGTKLDNYDSLDGALQFIYGDCVWRKDKAGRIDTAAIIERIWSPDAAPSESRRKYLNWPSVHESAWVTPEEWAQLADPTISVAPGDAVTLFFDGSRSRDATALIGCRVSDGHVFTVGIWEPNPSHDANSVVDADDVDRVVAAAFDRWDVVAFFADVREFESFVLTDWPATYGDRLQTWSAPRTKPPQSIAWDMRGNKEPFARACEMTHSEIVSGQFTHDGSSTLARHVANARRRPYRDWISIQKESPGSSRKIDAAVAMVGARLARRLHLAAPAGRQRSGVIW
jgi:hypothetical protein